MVGFVAGLVLEAVAEVAEDEEDEEDEEGYADESSRSFLCSAVSSVVFIVGGAGLFFAGTAGAAAGAGAGTGAGGG